MSGTSASATVSFSESESVVPLTKGGHRHRIKTFSALKKDPTKSVYSNIFSVGGHEWQVVCYPGGETEEVGEFISLFLGYRGPSDRCQATWLLRCVNQLDPESPRERRWAKGDRYNTFSVGRRWGWQRFIKREQLLDPSKGYCINDTVIFETEVTVHGNLVTVDRPMGSAGFSHLHNDILAHWPVPSPSVSSDMMHLFTNQQELADVEFFFPEDDGKSIFGHSQVLAARSPVFAKMFGGGYMESVGAAKSIRSTSNSSGVAGGTLKPCKAGSQKKRPRSSSSSSSSRLGSSATSTSGSTAPVSDRHAHHDSSDSLVSHANISKRIEMIDVQFEVFEEFMKFLYSGNTDPALHAPLNNSDNEEEKTKEVTEAMIEANKQRTEFVAALMVVANRYEMNRLRLICERTLASGLTIENAALTLSLADTHCADKLKEYTLQFITKNAKEVRNTPGFREIGIELLHELFTLTATSSSPESLKRKRHVLAEGESWLDYTRKLKSTEIRRSLAERGLNSQGSKTVLIERLAESLEKEFSK